MGSLFSFNKLITPSIIKIIFGISVFLVGLGSFGLFVTGYEESSSTILGLLCIFPALIIFIIGVIIARVSAEMTLVIFMIRDELAWQRVRLSEPHTATPSTETL